MEIKEYIVLPGYKISKATVLSHFLTSISSSQCVSGGVRQEIFDYRFNRDCIWNAIVTIITDKMNCGFGRVIQRKSN